ncbi:MAG: preprotein translocase subunit SecE, partial [Planctomycetaceae bacterium]|nr:preprotein translocase subunit SecE [Planctomycetaceae bacterium]
YPRFADFLVAVEAEMDKVTWVGRQELVRQAIVVVVVMFLLAFVLLAYDVLWQEFFQWVGFLQLTSS